MLSLALSALILYQLLYFLRYLLQSLFETYMCTFHWKIIGLITQVLKSQVAAWIWMWTFIIGCRRVDEKYAFPHFCIKLWINVSIQSANDNNRNAVWKEDELVIRLAGFSETAY